MASKTLTVYVLKELYAHEVFMRDAYKKQLETIPPGEVGKTIERIYEDEIRHCNDFEKLLKHLDSRWEPHAAKAHPRDWNCAVKEELKEALEFDWHMETDLEENYIEHLSKTEIMENAVEEMKKILQETHAHSEIIKLLLSEL